MSIVQVAAIGYLGIINVASVGLFWYDKHQARTKGWRVPEKQLQLSALLGGWIGGFWAMQTFKHKTVKESFKIPYIACAAVNACGIGCVSYLWMTRASFRQMITQRISAFAPWSFSSSKGFQPQIQPQQRKSLRDKVHRR